MQIHFLAVDGFNLIRRIFEARQAQTEADMPDVIQVAKNSLIRALNRHKPTHAAVILEDHTKTWRHLLYPAYKTNRSPTPPLLLQFLGHPEIATSQGLSDTQKSSGHPESFTLAFESAGVRSCSIESYEADDVIATIARRVEEHNGKVTILSTDKIFLQLLSARVVVFDHFNEKSWCDQDVQEKYGVGVVQFVDFLALSGDSSNNIKGVQGVGPKSAIELLNQYGDLSRIFDSEDETRLVRKVQDNAPDAGRCRQLIQLKTDVELGLNLKSFRL